MSSMSRSIDKSKPTLRQLYFVLGKNSYLWRLIGEKLNFDYEELNNIEEEFKKDGQQNNSRCMIELFDKWLMKNNHCTWEVIITALHDLKKTKLENKIFHYANELRRIKNYRFFYRCKTFYPLNDFCYEEQELGKRYFETDTLARAKISDYKESVIECLIKKSTLWYEMGLFMDLSKEKLDQIRQKLGNRSPERALRVMFEEAIEAKAYCLTWRVVIDALLDMELNEIAEEVDSLAADNAVTRIASIRMRRNNFNETSQSVKFASVKMRRNTFEGCGTRQSGKLASIKYRRRMSEGIGMGQSEKFKLRRCSFAESGTRQSKKVKQKQDLYVKKIRKILLVDEDVSDEDLLENIQSYIVTRNPSISDLREVAENLKTIGELSIEDSEEYTKTAVKLLKDLEKAKSKINALTKEKNKLKSLKCELQAVSIDVNKKILKLNGSLSADKKAKLQRLEEQNQHVLEQLEGIYEKLKKCILELDRANSDYKSICRQLSELNYDLKRCKQLLSYILSASDGDGFSAILEIYESLNRAFTAIESTDMKIEEVEDSLYSAEHPYVSELKQVDPYRCTVEGEGAKRAEVGVIAVAILQTKNFEGEPCEANEDKIDCKIVSTITGAEKRCFVKNHTQNEYEIRYKPLVKGWHKLFIKFEEKSVGKGSPFKVAVKAPIRTLGNPIRIIDRHLDNPKDVAVSKTGEIFVTGKNGISKFSPDGTFIQLIGENRAENYVRIAIENNENILVTDCLNSIMKFDAESGDFIYSGETSLERPLSIACNNGNKLYIADGYSPRVEVLNSNFGVSCIVSANKIINYVACDDAGLIYAIDNSNHSIMILRPEGDQTNLIECNDSCFTSVAVDKDGFLYVSDLETHTIRVYNTNDGELVKVFWSQLLRPSEIAVDDCGVVYVCDKTNCCIQLF